MTQEKPIRFRHYDIIKTVGHGPFGAVYLAYDIKWERNIALKLLHSHLVPNTVAMKRFINEARTMQELRHLLIVNISHVEEDSPQPYIEMEFIDGLSLEGYLQSGMLPIQRALRLLRQIADILDSLHEQGIIHRNLKPSNVLINQEGQIKLADFGLNFLMASQKHHSKANILVGDSHYLAPEQTLISRHHEVGAVTDVYSLAVIAFQMLTGSVPFDGRTNAILSAHRTISPPNPRHLGIKLSKPITAVLMQGLAKQPVERYVTAGAFVTALEQAARSEETLLELPPSLITQPRPLLKKTKKAPSQMTIQSYLRQPALIAAALLLLIFMTGAAMQQIWKEQSPPATTGEFSSIVKPSPTSQAGENVPSSLGSDNSSLTPTPTAPQETSTVIVAEKESPTNVPVVTNTALATNTALPTDTIIPTPTKSPTEANTAPTKSATTTAVLATKTAVTARATVFFVNEIVISASSTAIPATPTAIPASPTAIPTEIPASPTAIPASPTAIPASPTAIPTEIPASPTDIPASPTAIPASPTAIPASPTEIPASPTEIPASPTEIPASPTASPTEIPIPASPTASPVLQPPLPIVESPTPTIINPIPVIPSSIPVSPTPLPTIQTLVPTEGTSSPTPIFTPVTETPIIATATIIPLTPTSDNIPIFTVPPTTTPTFRYRINTVLPNFNLDCPSYSIFGYVYDSQGGLLPGIRVRIYNENGYQSPIVLTKTEPLGQYEQPILSGRSRWYVEIVDSANNPLSPKAELISLGNIVEGSTQKACWHQVDFWALK